MFVCQKLARKYLHEKCSTVHIAYKYSLSLVTHVSIVCLTTYLYRQSSWHDSIYWCVRKWIKCAIVSAHEIWLAQETGATVVLVDAQLKLHWQICTKRFQNPVGWLTVDQVLNRYLPSV